MKGQLRCADGKFRILMLSDIQEYADFDKRVTESINRLLDREKPDLVMLGGDNAYGPEMRTEQNFDTFLAKLAAPFEEHGIYWAHIFGNHDHDITCLSDMEKQTRFEAYPHCVSGHSDGIHGVTNYYLDILGKDDQPFFRLWCLDTNGDIHHGETETWFEGGLNGQLFDQAHFDILYFDQLMWYYNTSLALEKQCGKRLPSILFTHMAPDEFEYLRNHPKESHLIGNTEEMVVGGALNSGLFSLAVQRREIRAIACGHTHMNSFQADYCGIKCCFDASAGYRCYGKDDLRGGRLFEIDEETGSFRTRMALYEI